MKLVFWTLVCSLALCFPHGSWANPPMVRGYTLPSHRQQPHPRASSARKTNDEPQVRHYNLTAPKPRPITKTKPYVAPRKEEKKIVVREYDLRDVNPVDPTHPLKGLVPEVKVSELEKHVGEATKIITYKLNQNKDFATAKSTLSESWGAIKERVRQVVREELKKHPTRTTTKVIRETRVVQGPAAAPAAAPRIDEAALEARITNNVLAKMQNQAKSKPAQPAPAEERLKNLEAMAYGLVAVVFVLFLGFLYLHKTKEDK
ncbi:MAG TPA: hypothetical protein VGE59_02880 [Patescibacteria group bacterium]